MYFGKAGIETDNKKEISMSSSPVRLAISCLAVLILLVLTSERGQAQDSTDYTVNPSLFQALEWRNIGPFRGGRVPAVAGHPAQHFP